MSLENLVKTRQLEPHETDVRQVADLLAAIRRGIADAKVEAISEETRFDAAYRAIMNCAMLALWANGFRPSRSAPGHHQTMIQTLVTSAGLERSEVQLLDTFRIKRNAIDYTGEMIDDASLDECILASERLLAFMLEWLKNNRSDLIS